MSVLMPARHCLALFLLAVGLLASGMVYPALPAAAAGIVIAHAQGSTTLADTPKKVLVFDPASLDTLDALGVEVTGVPGSNIPNYLSKYADARYLKIGTLFEPDYEAVNAAQPDLIIVAARSAPAYRNLAAIAPTIDLTVPPDHFVDGTRRNIETLGRIFGKQAQADAIVKEIDAGVARMKADAGKMGTALLIMVNGGKLTAYGPGSRFGWLHSDLGVTPAVPDIKAATHGEAISFEFILEHDPDWLIVLDRDAAVGQAGESARQVLDNELIARTRAARRNHILYVDPVRWYIVGSGATAIRSVIADLAAVVEKSTTP